ncbi:MAG: hypothetical protein HY017_02260 [Betaproteobacteria bacterium]|nr:hypothetical protein [Betaproteobacteria bacterium]
MDAFEIEDRHRRGEVIAVAALVADVLAEQQEQDVVPVLTGIHAAAQFGLRSSSCGTVCCSWIVMPFFPQ